MPRLMETIELEVDVRCGVPQYAKITPKKTKPKHWLGF